MKISGSYDETVVCSSAFLIFLRTLLALIAFTLTGCATLNSTPPRIHDKALLQAEQQQLQRAAMEKQVQLLQHAHGLIWPILQANHELCEKTNNDIGLAAGGSERVAEISKITKSSIEQLGIKKGIRVLYTVLNAPAAQAKIQAGDEIIAINNESLASTISDKEFEKALQKAADAGALTLKMKSNDDANPIEVSITPEKVCTIKLEVNVVGELNASAGLTKIQITAGLMERVHNDRYIQLVAAHELAHLSQGHVIKGLRNLVVTGGIIYVPILGIVGSVFDAALNLLPIKKPEDSLARLLVGYSTPYRLDLEREADYIGTYMLARAGVDLDDVENVFKVLALTSPKSTHQLGLSHPEPHDRILTTRETLKEIAQKRANNEALIPNGFKMPEIKRVP